MPVVVICPACQQKARVPDAMLGQSVKCPACAATFTAPADAAPAPPPPPADDQSDSPTRPPLPADADSLRSVRSGVGMQLIAHCIYAAALAMNLFLLLTVLADNLWSGLGRRTAVGPAVPVLVNAAALFVAVACLLNLVGAAVCVLAPPIHLARGLAIAVLVLTMFAFMELNATFRGTIFMDESPSRFGSIWQRYWLTGAVVVWLVEVTRLSVLALFWRAMSRTLRDARGAALARRLAIGGPAVQMSVVAAWIVIATLGVDAQDVAMLAITSWLAVQLMVVLGGIGVVARLWRRLKATVPAGA